MAYSTGRKAERNCNSLAVKKGMKKVGAREVVQSSNYNCFLDLDVDVAFAGCPIGYYIVGGVPNIAINKNSKTPCNQMPKIATE